MTDQAVYKTFQNVIVSELDGFFSKFTTVPFGNLKNFIRFAGDSSLIASANNVGDYNVSNSTPFSKA